jgi:hypothetical protein
MLVDGPQHHAHLRAHRHHTGIGFGRNEPLQRPGPASDHVRADRSAFGARHGIYHAPGARRRRADSLTCINDPDSSKCWCPGCPVAEGLQHSLGVAARRRSRPLKRCRRRHPMCIASRGVSNRREAFPNWIQQSPGASYSNWGMPTGVRGSGGDSTERSCLRERTPSLANTLPRCHSTVRGLRNS